MREDEKFLRIFGGIFFASGLLIVAVGIVLGIFGHGNEGTIFGGLLCGLVGLVFASVGGGILIAQIKKGRKGKKLSKMEKNIPERYIAI